MTYTIGDLLYLFSPSTLASLIADVDQTDAHEMFEPLRAAAFSALIANVGEAKTADMLGDWKPDEEEEVNTFICHFCQRVETMPDCMVPDGWLPSYWVGEIEVCNEVCPECIKTRLEFCLGEARLIGTADFQPA
jgi:hypothetical protein